MMPEDERDGLYDHTEDYGWDCDLQLPFDEELGGDDDEEEDE